MINIQEVTKDIYWIGGSDRRLALFENLFPLPKGVSYNSYIVLDEKTAVFDTADISISDQYLENLKTALAGRARLPRCASYGAGSLLTDRDSGSYVPGTHSDRQCEDIPDDEELLPGDSGHEEDRRKRG